jgi:TP901 family phage tail tape measure protein
MNFVSSITLAFKDAFSPGFNSAKNSLAGMRSALDELGNNSAMYKLAADMSTAISNLEPMRNALKSIMDQPSKLAGTFGSSMRNIQSLTGETNAELAELQNKLLGVGSTSTAGPRAVADAFYNITSGIGDASVRMAALQGAISLAESGQADLGAATSGLISVINAFGSKEDQITGLSDVFFQTVRKGVGSLDGFVNSMSSVAGLSASVGIGFDELGAAMAFVTAKGQTESVAAHQLKAAMIAFMKPTSDMQAALASMGIESGSAMIKEYGLAESLRLVKTALGGNDDAMAQALGSTEALQASIALTAGDYRAFAASYAEGLDGSTAAGLEAQTQSYESKVARLNSATEALQISFGDKANSIKGFFVDIGAGFLSDVVNPLMNTPLGGALSTIAAGVGIVAEGVLDLGFKALNGASQMATLATNISNAGGIAKMFKSSIGMLTSGFSMLMTPLKAMGGGLLKMGTAILGALPAIGGWIASMWASATATLAAAWPIIAIIAGVAALAAAVYLVIDNWDAIADFFVDLWEGVKDVFVSVWNAIVSFFESVWEGIKSIALAFWDFLVGLWDDIGGIFIGVGAAIMLIASPITAIIAAVAALGAAIYLIIDNWDAIADFFVDLWEGIKSVFVSVWNAIVGFFKKIWNAIKAPIVAFVNFYVSIWTGIFNFFKGLWEKIKGLINQFTQWFSGIWDGVKAVFVSVWQAIIGFFEDIWNGIKSVVQSVCDWICGAFDDVVGFIKSAFGIVSDIVGAIGGFISSIFGSSEKYVPAVDDAAWAAQLEALNATESGRKLMETFGAGIEMGAGISRDTLSTQLAAMARQLPHSDAPEGPLSTLTASGRALTDTFASGIQSNSGIAGEVFGEALQGIAVQLPHSDAPEGPLSTLSDSGRALTDAFASGMEGGKPIFAAVPPPSSEGGQNITINIQNQNLNAEECQTLFDFLRMMMHAVEGVRA